MLLSVLRIGKTRIDPVVRTDSYEIHIKREDRIFFSQGTKIRKLLGIYQSLLPEIQSGRIEKFILQGNLHSNAILAGVLFLRNVGVPTKVLGYSRDPKLVSPASVLASRFSELELYPGRREWEKAVEDTTKSSLSGWDLIAEDQDSPRSLLLPEYLFCREALEGLSSLWEEIDPSSFDRIVLDVGSGLTWISGIQWGRIPITGICLGLRKERTISWLQENLSSLRQTLPPLPWNSLIEPREKLDHPFSFGKKGGFWEEKADEYERRFGIYLEPIYAAKSFAVLEEMAKSGELKGRILYIYQGGALQGMSLDNKKASR
ncbi:1-aminocyclopropane-1-carboxylate deaminase [Leptospira langatensis]|uniref:1-aminocyclopropane-1-carboxylate deaminase n=1 Tax=Leptospira langatensis TaxID=2484983 RepID=A0A5F1ZZP2_9LEPT|nr:1-aminocyclopropane-1-carboxylate deaminase [Leptospira langatensis]TGJ98563.1 1-aminocyclopropane-1-carboxylate deaminase [Leptospira langatensis]TGL43477.1 1-aminocyclopropane-1-carboxylate deaminase [Leptospira langatensis]